MKSLRILFFWVILPALSGCDLLEISKQVEAIDQAGIIRGRIVVAVPRSGTVIVRLYYLKDRTFVSDEYTQATASGEFHFEVLPGTYYLAAFIDQDGDTRYKEDESANYYQTGSGKPAPVKIGPGEVKDVGVLRISGKPPPLEGYKALYLPAKVIANIGARASLDDPMFSRKNSALGLWRPLQFLEQVGGGLFLLEDYQADKIPVLFVHGLDGTPLDWKTVLDHLDRNRFQPWVIYYPSGFRLDLISGYLVKAVVTLHNRYRFKRIFVIAHSMGGLVARAAIRKTIQKFPQTATTIRLLVTVNSPLGGMESAAMGVKHSPIVLPVWRDLDPQSRFMREMAVWFLPDTIAYHLFFSYVEGRSDDEVVPLKSQIPLQNQLHASRIYGFNDTHTGTLSNPGFIKLFNSILGKAAATGSILPPWRMR